MAKKAVKKTVKKKMTLLPRKMSSLIGIALKDIRKAEKVPTKFVIDMGTYFVPDNELVCQVNDTVISTNKVCVMCAAGSVMAFTLGMANSKSTLTPAAFGKNTDQLHAIDALRQGSITSAASQLGFDDLINDGYGNYNSKYLSLNSDIPEYDVRNPEPFHKAMEKLKTKLVKVGL